MKKSVLIECLKAIPGNPDIAICDNRLLKKRNTRAGRTYKHFDVEYLDRKETTDNKPLGILRVFLVTKK